MHFLNVISKQKKIYTRIPVHFIMNYKCITWLDTSGLRRSDPNHGPEKDSLSILTAYAYNFTYTYSSLEQKKVPDIEA